MSRSLKYSLGHVVSSMLFALHTCVTRGAGSGHTLFPFGPTQLLLSYHLPDLSKDALGSEVRKPPLTQIVFLSLFLGGGWRAQGTFFLYILASTGRAAIF